MGQQLFKDKIGTVQHAGGNIIMLASVSNPAYLTIGGQQYKITSNLSVALPAMTANSRYQVFAVASVGVVSLVISTNENSVGPTGSNRWKLISSLYSNGAPSVAFGSFVNISGVPKTDPITNGVTVLSAHTTPPTKGSGILIDQVRWWRDGIWIYGKYEYSQTIAGSAGNGNYFLNAPTNFLIDPSMHPHNSDGFSGINGDHRSDTKMGEGDLNLNGAPAWCICQPFDSTRFRIFNWEITTTAQPFTGGWGSNDYNFANPNLEYVFDIKYKAVGLTNTPIEDL